MIAIDDLLGIPFKIHGRDKNGFDCYGLVIEVSKRFGHTLVDMYNEYDNVNNEKSLDTNTYNIINGSKLSKVDTPSLSDILLFFDRKHRTTHIGVYLTDDNFIHCDSYGVRISKLKTYFRKWSAYRWVK